MMRPWRASRKGYSIPLSSHGSSSSLDEDDLATAASPWHASFPTAWYAYWVAQALLAAFTLVGIRHFFGVYVTGTIRVLPSYSKDDLRRTGWARPSIMSATPPFVSDEQPAGRLSVLNLSYPPSTTVTDLNLLILTPLHDAARFLPRFFDQIDSFAHPKSKTSLGFLVSDETDLTGETLVNLVEARRASYREITVVKRDFTMELPGGKARHKSWVQEARRSILAKARTLLLMSALRPEHDWVLWLDADVVQSSPHLFEDLLYYGGTGPRKPLEKGHNEDWADVVTANVFLVRGGKPKGYDLNNWAETPASLAAKAKLDDDRFLIENRYGLPRSHLVDLRHPPTPELASPISYLSPFEASHSAPSSAAQRNNLYDRTSSAYIGKRVNLDGVGGVATLVRADAHRFGAVFPGWLVDHQLETEGFAVIAKRLGARIVGLPNYVVVHADNG